MDKNFAISKGSSKPKIHFFKKTLPNTSLRYADLNSIINNIWVTELVLELQTHSANTKGVYMRL